MQGCRKRSECVKIQREEKNKVVFQQDSVPSKETKC